MGRLTSRASVPKGPLWFRAVELGCSELGLRLHLLLLPNRSLQLDFTLTDIPKYGREAQTHALPLLGVEHVL